MRRALPHVAAIAALTLFSLLLCAACDALGLVNPDRTVVLALAGGFFGAFALAPIRNAVAHLLQRRRK